MSKFYNFIDKADKFLKAPIDRNSSGFDRFMWRSGKWFIVIGMPYMKTIWWYKWYSTPSIWLWLLFMVVYSFCAFAVFIDISKFIRFIIFLCSGFKRCSGFGFEDWKEYYIELSPEEIQYIKRFGFFVKSIQIPSDDYIIMEEENRIYLSERIVDENFLYEHVKQTK